MKNEIILKLINQPLPEPSIDKFSYISTRKVDIENWLTNLTLLNMAEISKQIRTTLIEVALFKTDAIVKLEIMELIRVSVYNLISSLNKHYLVQSLVLDGKELKIAELVQLLRAYDFAIYKQICLELTSSNQNKPIFSKLFGKSNNRTSIALHRSMSAIVGIIHETSLLYLKPFAGSWQQLYKLYSVGQKYKLLDTKVEDSLLTLVNTKTTVKDVYIRGILMSCFKTNSLRQQEIQKLFQASQLWSTHVSDSSTPSANDLLVVDLNSDAEPVYITTEKALSSSVQYINLSNLIKHLKDISNTKTSDNDFESQLTRTRLIDYIIKSMEEPAERTTSRHPFEGKLIAAVGMSSCHYHISNKKKFEEVIQLNEYIKEQQSSSMLMDMDHSFGFEDDEDSSDQTKTNTSKLYGLSHVDIADISPGGYRISWNGSSPNVLKTGEPICLREDDSKPWQFGVIRWVEQKPNQGADLGIEILAHNASPCGVLPCNHTDENAAFMRAIILPEVKSLNRAATILTPNYQFKKGHRIKIRKGNAEVIAKLGEQYLKTHGFHQYDFTLIPSKKTS